MGKQQTRTAVPAELTDLALYAGLARQERPSELTYAEWRAILSPCPPHERFVVIYRLLYGATDAEVGEMLGVSRGRASQFWFSALRRLGGSRALRQVLAAVTGAAAPKVSA